MNFFGTSNKDIVMGIAGDDVLFGDAGSDSLKGRGGDGTLDGGQVLAFVFQGAFSGGGQASVRYEFDQGFDPAAP